MRHVTLHTVPGTVTALQQCEKRHDENPHNSPLSNHHGEPLSCFPSTDYSCCKAVRIGGKRVMSLTGTRTEELFPLNCDWTSLPYAVQSQPRKQVCQVNSKVLLLFVCLLFVVVCLLFLVLRYNTKMSTNNLNGNVTKH